MYRLNRIKKGKSIIYTMWEASNLLEGSVMWLNNARLVIVPSAYCKEMFVSNQIKPNVVIVPLGVNTNIYYPQPKLNTESCVFGLAGTLYTRKNVPFVIEAFKKAFTNKNAILRIKTTPSSDVSKLKTNHPRIQVNFHTVSEDGMRSWYNGLNALVSCSHSEGFGLHQLESMACGVPLISPKFGGVTEFFDESVGYCVDYKITDAKKDGDSTYRGTWSSAIEESLITQMRHVYENRNRARELGQAAAQRALEFTWDHTATKLLKILNNYYYLCKFV